MRKHEADNDKNLHILHLRQMSIALTLVIFQVIKLVRKYEVFLRIPGV